MSAADLTGEPKQRRNSLHAHDGAISLIVGRLKVDLLELLARGDFHGQLQLTVDIQGTTLTEFSCGAVRRRKLK